MSEKPKLPFHVSLAIKQFIENHADKIYRTGNSPEWAIVCPDTDCPSNEKQKLKLYFNVETGIGICFRCSTFYAMPFLVRAYRGGTLEAARAIVRDWYGFRAPDESIAERLRNIKDVRSPGKKEDDDDVVMMDLPESFIPVERDDCPRYIRERIGIEQALRYRVGYCQSGFFAGRMIVPVYMPDGLRTFVARVMSKNVPRRIQKVIYPKGTKISQCLFNYPRLRRYNKAVLVEGVFDAMRGGPYYQGVFGTRISNAQLLLLRKARIRDLVIMLDPDAKMKALVMAKKAQAALDLEPRVAYLESDPDDYTRKELRRIERLAQAGSISQMLA